MKVKTTATVQLKNDSASMVAEHALLQHGTVYPLKHNRVRFERAVSTGSLLTATEQVAHAVHVVLTQEAGIEVGAYRLVAVSAEVV